MRWKSESLCRNHFIGFIFKKKVNYCLVWLEKEELGFKSHSQEGKILREKKVKLGVIFHSQTINEGAKNGYFGTLISI
jgi:hypothetical protein